MKDKDLAIILVIIAAVFLVPSILHGGMMGFGFPIWIIMLAVVYYVLKERPEGESCLEILKKAYVLGEITREEYLKKKEDILSQ